MAVMDQVRSMKRLGMNDSQIASYLQEQGVAPRDINSAMSQVNIKDAVSNPVEANQYPNYNSQGETKEYEQGDVQPGMQPSMLDLQNQQQPSPVQNPSQFSENIEPLPQQGRYAQEMSGMPPSPMDVPQPGASYPESYSQESYGGYPQEYPSGGGYGNSQQQGYEDYASQDTMSEVASQIVAEKTKSISKKVSDLGEIGTLLTAKVEKMDERLSRIESIMDQLQASLLRKATAQEQNISDIKTEMEAMQQSFGKVINPLVTSVRKRETRTHSKRKTSKKGKKK